MIKTVLKYLRLNAISLNKSYYISERFIVTINAHKIRGVPSHPGKIKGNPWTVWTEMKRVVEIGRVIG